MLLKLYYIPVRARAEPIRMALRYSHIQFEDISVTYPELREKKRAGFFPLGQVPVLGVDGKLIPQSGAIMRYVAGIGGLVPKDPLQALEADAVFETAQEVMKIVNPIVNRFQDDELTSNFGVLCESLSKYLSYFSSAMGEGEFFGGASVCYADFATFHVVDLLLLIRPACLNQHENLKLWYDRVQGLRGVAEYIASRPELPPARVAACELLASK